MIQLKNKSKKIKEDWRVKLKIIINKGLKK
jgi:hypothetical protein